MIPTRYEPERWDRPDKGVVLRYLLATCGYSRAQLTRLLARVLDGQSLHKRYRAPAHAFARRYTPADALLLAEVDRAHGTLSGPATAHLLKRAWHVFGDARFERLASLSVSHLYNLRRAVCPPRRARTLQGDGLLGGACAGANHQTQAG